MVVTLEHQLPTDEELTVPELNLSGPALRAGSFHLGKYCQKTFNEFMLCREELGDPRQCLPEGRDVTACSFEFFRLVKKHCHQEFTQYANCLDKSSSDLHFRHCRNTQGVYDKCVLDNLKLERPGYGYFCRAQVHDTTRPKPPERQRPTYDNVPNFLPDDEPRTKAPYESRFVI